MSGIAALVPEHRWVNAGLELADSYCTNPHKWMGINFDCDLFWTVDRASLLGALSILPEYLRSTGRRERRGDRLPRLAGPARPSLPLAEAVVPPAHRRCRAGAGDDPRARPPDSAAGRTGRRRRALRDRRRASAEPAVHGRCAMATRPPIVSSRTPTPPARCCSPAPCSTAGRCCDSRSEPAQHRNVTCARRGALLQQLA